MSTPTKEPGPWEAVFYEGSSGARFWTHRRVNPAWWGGYEIKQTAGFKPLRFKTQAAAVAALAKSPTPTGAPKP